MKFLFALLILIVSPSSMADSTGCHVFVPEREFLHDGYSIRFDFGPLLSTKGYEEVYEQQQADLILKLTGAEVEGPRFHEAHASLELGATRVESKVTCLTQLCGIADFGKAFSKSYKRLEQSLPACKNESH